MMVIPMRYLRILFSVFEVFKFCILKSYHNLTAGNGNLNSQIKTELKM